MEVSPSGIAPAPIAKLRAGEIPTQTQSSIALSGDGLHWYIVNCSPDIRAQFDAFPALHPAPFQVRNSPLQAVFLTNADLDHTAGLLFLREGNSLTVHASKAVRECLTISLAFTSILEAFCGITWLEPSLDWQPLSLCNAKPSGLAYRAIPLPSPPPTFSSPLNSMEEQTLAFHFKDERTGQTVLMAPDVFEVTDPLRDALHTADAVLFDGTFWSDDELSQVKCTTKKASDMGHLPINSGSLDLLSQLPARHRIYLHINNTNPIFRVGSEERLAVENAGIAVGRDGMELEL